ncbi:hypothetical protein ACFY2W_26990 [Streptomyces sp. NPDC001262]|uniref:hypothetical protein n=1 Tax=unclassified Streptomyces TaxID=2593676 RepID=UPI0036AC6193
MTDPDPRTPALPVAVFADDAQALPTTALGQAAAAAATPNAVTPVLVIDQPQPGAVLFIDETPTAPAFTCAARIVGVMPDPTPNTAFNWTMTTVDTTARRVTCKALEEAPGLVGGQWTPSPDVRGGDVTITVTATVAGTTVTGKVGLKILGRNPDESAVRAFCQAVGGTQDGTNLILIARHETRFQQFDPATHLPKVNPTSDAGGIMQLLNPPASCEARWNWQQNVREAADLLSKKRAGAIGDLAPFRDAAGHFRSDRQWPNDQVLRYETLQRYAGGTYWDRDQDKKILIRNPGRRDAKGNWIPSGFINELGLPE